MHECPYIACNRNHVGGGRVPRMCYMYSNIYMYTCGKQDFHSLSFWESHPTKLLRDLYLPHFLSWYPNCMCSIYFFTLHRKKYQENGTIRGRKRGQRWRSWAEVAVESYRTKRGTSYKATRFNCQELQGKSIYNLDGGLGDELVERSHTKFPFFQNCPGTCFEAKCRPTAFEIRTVKV